MAALLSTQDPSRSSRLAVAVKISRALVVLLTALGAAAPALPPPAPPPPVVLALSPPPPPGAGPGPPVAPWTEGGRVSEALSASISNPFRSVSTSDSSHEEDVERAAAVCAAMDLFFAAMESSALPTLSCTRLASRTRSVSESRSLIRQSGALASLHDSLRSPALLTLFSSLYASSHNFFASWQQ